MDILFSIGDDKYGRRYQFKMNFRDLLIPGNFVGEDQDHCYIAVFKSIHGKQDTWIFGNLVMEYFYIVYDMTPQDEGNLGYLQLGIAPKDESHHIHYEEGAFSNILGGVEISEDGLEYKPLPPPPPAPEAPEDKNPALKKLFIILIIVFLVLALIIVVVMIKFVKPRQ